MKNSVRILIAVAIGVFNIGDLIKAQTIVTLLPNKDAFISHQVNGVTPYSDLNFGNDTRFMARTWTSGGVPFSDRSLIEFDLSSIPANAVIIEAKLILYGVNHQILGEAKSNSAFFQRVTEN